MSTPDEPFDWLQLPDWLRDLTGSLEYYILVDGEFHPATLLEWAQWNERDGNRSVENTQLPGGAWVSTIFLGLDHAMGGPMPLFFETAYCLGDTVDMGEGKIASDIRGIWRTPTLGDAKRVHYEVVERIKAGLVPNPSIGVQSIMEVLIHGMEDQPAGEGTPRPLLDAAQRKRLIEGSHDQP